MSRYTPRGDDAVNRNLTIQLPPEYRARLEAMADRNGSTLSGIVRVAIREFLAQFKQENE